MHPSRVNGVLLNQLQAYPNMPNVFVFKQWILPSPLFVSEPDWE